MTDSVNSANSDNNTFHLLCYNSIVNVLVFSEFLL